MSFDHKAYEFDWVAFDAELAPILQSSLEEEQGTLLEDFVRRNLGVCKSPYDGSQLNDHWIDLLESKDVQSLADFALTKYYNPNDDFGLNGSWPDLCEVLSSTEQQALLGQPFGPTKKLFDPGLQGSYFQPPHQVSQSVAFLAPLSLSEVAAFRERLVRVAARGKGMYVTF